MKSIFEISNTPAHRFVSNLMSLFAEHFPVQRTRNLDVILANIFKFQLVPSIDGNARNVQTNNHRGCW